MASIFMKSLFRQRTPPNPHATQMDNNTKYTTQLDKNTEYTTHTTFSEKNLRQVKCHHTLEKTVSTDHVNHIDSISVFFLYISIMKAQDNIPEAEHRALKNTIKGDYTVQFGIFWLQQVHF